MTSFHLAPEWARQDAVILVWPSQHSDWAKQTSHSNLLSSIEQTYLELIHYLVRHQIVLLVTYDITHKNHIESLLLHKNISLSDIRFIEIPTNDTWIRDYGPITVQFSAKEGMQEYKFLDFNFDAWGEKYPFTKDNAFNQSFITHLNKEPNCEKIDFTIEAGNLEIDNKGTLLTSSSCYKRKSSKHHFSQTSLEEKFNAWFGCTQVYWIDNVTLSGDDTDGHIDNLARFCDDDVIAYSAFGHGSDPNTHALKNLAKSLTTIAKNRSYELIPLPMPDPIFINGIQLPASYTNFLISNEYVFVPVFSDKRDKQTLKLIDECFPTREIIDIESNALIQQFGGIHCATMQIPQGCIA